jgi:DNA-binding CsgD family transcriptional regulator
VPQAIRSLNQEEAGMTDQVWFVTGDEENSAAPDGLREPLSKAEARVLRYLPTNLTMPEIADQLYLSVNTVRTHTRHIYEKLDAHRRHEVVDRARALGLLAPSARRPSACRPSACRPSAGPAR